MELYSEVDEMTESKPLYLHGDSKSYGGDNHSIGQYKYVCTRIEKWLRFEPANKVRKQKEVIDLPDRFVDCYRYHFKLVDIHWRPSSNGNEFFHSNSSSRELQGESLTNWEIECMDYYWEGY